MGGWGSRKALQSARNAVRVVSAELYACGLATHYTPEKTTPQLEEVLVKLGVARMTSDRYYKPELDRIVNLVEGGEVSPYYHH